MSKSILVTLFVLVLSTSNSQSEELHSYFDQSVEPRFSSITISPCTGVEVAECILHSLSCGPTPYESPEFEIVSGNVEKIVSSLVVGTEGQAKAQLELSEGSTSIDLTIYSIEVRSNEMDGGWIVILDLDPAEFFDELTEKNSEGASIVVAGDRFLLAPQKGDGKKLVEWKNACTAIKAK
jgi:hypothetical protein